jgi:hypothetical protein
MKRPGVSVDIVAKCMPTDAWRRLTGFPHLELVGSFQTGKLGDYVVQFAAFDVQEVDEVVLRQFHRSGILTRL